MKQVELEVKNPTGLHARPANMFARTAQGYTSNITIHHNGRKFNAKSIVHVLTAGITAGTRIVIEAEGPDEDAAIDGIAKAVASGLGEKID